MQINKKMKKIIMQVMLKLMARLVLKRRKPIVVGITGSVGKTTTKEVVAKVLSMRFKVRSNQKNYNTEIGVPLTILGCQIDYSKNKILQFFAIFYYWLQAMFFNKEYPKILVLEMGADKPGDIKYFCNFIPINVGVLTDIGISHLENFKTKQNLATEKGHLLRSVAGNGMAVYNYDNKTVRDIGQKMSTSTISYGLDERAKMKATDIVNKIEINSEFQKNDGIIFKLNYQGKVLPVRLKNCAGKGVIYSVLAAFSVGIYFQLNLIEMIEALKDFIPCSRRLNLIKGKNNSLIIDDSYNSSPASLDLALDLVKNIKAQRKIVILGDMLELGEEEKSSHKQLGSKVADLKPDYFIAIGKRMEKAIQSYSNKNKKDKEIMTFENSQEAKGIIEKLIQPGDLILVKGSLGMKMDKITNHLMK